MGSPLDVLDDETRAELPRQSPPDWLTPMKAVLTDAPFSDPEWIFERKLDGVRLILFKNGDDVRVMTRNQKERNGAYPEIVEALRRESVQDIVLDGEVVAFEGNQTSFSRLQGRMQLQDPDAARATGIAIHAYLFDVLHIEGHDLREIALRDRKRVLRAAIDFVDPLRSTTYRNEDGQEAYRQACQDGWEGLIAKRADSPYRSTRSRDWLKLKCVAEQELVVAGFTEPQGERVGFGALLVGYWSDDGDGRALHYAGKVGTGYDHQTLRELRTRLQRLERETPPFPDGTSGLPRKGVHWVTPELVAQIGFTEWTNDGRLRHPRFLGLRYDKDADEVVRERPSSG